MIREIKIKSPEASNNISSYVFKTALFQDKWGEMEKGIPEWLHMMNHVYQDKNFPLTYTYGAKSFQSTESTLLAYNHKALSCLGPCKVHDVDPSLGQLNHYRVCKQKDNNNYMRFCVKSEKERETAVWMIKDQVITNSLAAIRKINSTSKG